MTRRILLNIDMQKDFCDPTGTLYVPGGEKDVVRTAEFIRKNVRNLSGIFSTLDSHYKLHIGNPLWFVDKKWNHPKPFTVIRSDDVKAGVWTTSRPDQLAWTIQYLEKLEFTDTLIRKVGKVHVIWPEHCIIGTTGHALAETLADAIHEWEETRVNIARAVTKGSDPRVEHFSAFRSEVPDPEDPSTLMNMDLVRSIEEADEIYLAGEATTHCVLATVTDLVNNFSSVDAIKKTTLFIDCTSAVPDPAPGLFSGPMHAFLNDMKSRGMRICKSTDVIF